MKHKKETRKEELLQNAKKIFSKKGYHSTTVSDIISEAKVARGTFYLYFDSKRAIFNELLDQLLLTISENIKRVDLDSPIPPIKQIEANVERVLNILTSDKDFIKILLREAVGLDEGFDKKLEEFYKKILLLIEWSLTLGQSMNIIRECNIKIASLVILGSIKEVLDHHLVNPEIMPDNKTLANEVVEIIANGLFKNK